MSVCVRVEERDGDEEREREGEREGEEGQKRYEATEAGHSLW